MCLFCLLRVEFPFPCFFSFGKRRCEESGFLRLLLPPPPQSIWEEVSEQASAGPLPRQPDGPQLLRFPHGEDADEQAEQEPAEAAL